MKRLAILALVSCAIPLAALEVNPDHTVTFTYTAPNAREVSVSGDFGKAGAMTKGDNGLWSVTLGPFDPDIHSYIFNVDGKQVADPLNNRSKPQRTGISNVFEIRGDKPSVWDRQQVPHGVVHLHEYDSKSVGTTRRLRVCTPSGYESSKDQRYPVLYLFHGSGDNESTWTDFGRAHDILDNLIATGRAKPMLIVMPDGHTAPPVPRDSPKAAEVRSKNVSSFEADLLTDVLPLIDSTYRTQADHNSRAIIGLSMGGNQSLIIGLNHPDIFAWVGCMSGTVREPDTRLASFLKNVSSANERFKTIWIACGKDDPGIEANHQFDALLNARQVKHTFVESDGAHSWPVWRRYLAEFAPLCFGER